MPFSASRPGISLASPADSAVDIDVAGAGIAPALARRLRPAGDLQRLEPGLAGPRPRPRRAACPETAPSEVRVSLRCLPLLSIPFDAPASTGRAAMKSVERSRPGRVRHRPARLRPSPSRNLRLAASAGSKIAWMPRMPATSAPHVVADRLGDSRDSIRIGVGRRPACPEAARRADAGRPSTLRPATVSSATASPRAQPLAESG